jgi:hypothetical protein
METHWDPTEFYGLVHQVGYPADVSTSRVSTVDMLMPADTSPDVRAVVNVACTIACGFVDDYLIQQAGDFLGIGGDFLKDLLDAGKGVSTYLELEDPVGLALFVGVTMLDALLGSLDMILDNLTAKLASMSKLSTVLGGAIFLLGQIPVALATAVANVAGFVTVEALTLELTAMSAALSAEIELIKGPVKAAQAIVDMLQGGLDVVLYMYNKYAANQAEQSERFDRAGKYRDLMRGNVFGMMTDWLNGVANALLMIPYAHYLQTAGSAW